MSKYKLSVGAMFKNESHCIKEWINHYLYHGVEHFYLINDNSDDNFMEIIKEYIEKDIITLFNVVEPYYLGRQRNLYNRFILPIIKETEWLIMVDLDEFVWSKQNINLYSVLESCSGYYQIQMTEMLFGSNGHISQPKYLVKSFTKRRENNFKNGCLKYIINSSCEFTSLNIHHADFINKEYTNDRTKFIQVYPEYFCYNHYKCQSRNFWDNVKCNKTDSDNYLIRTPNFFVDLDINEIEDTELYNQNINLFDNDDS
jgi:hypothetical protein